MSTYFYQARTTQGEIQTGVIEAGSHDAAVAVLQRHGLFITNLAETQSRSLFKKDFKLFERISRKELVNFSRQISVLFEARVPLVESVRTLGEQTKNLTFRKTLMAIATDVDSGKPFSEALSRFPKVFSPFYVNIIKSGEASGRLEEAFNYLADYLDREYALISKVRGAFIYPIFVFVVFVVVTAIMVVFIVPKLQDVLNESGQQFPLPTRVLIGLSGFARSYGIFLLLGLAIAGIMFFYYIKTKEGKVWWDAVSLRMPIFGNLLKNIYVARFSDNLGTLISSGLPIIQAIGITKNIVGNEMFARMLAEAEEAVKRGEMINTVVHGQWFVPGMVAEMIAVGEKTGKLDVILGHVARFFRREVDVAVENIVSLIEPILIVSLGLIVAVLVAAILLPIYNLASAF
ncbi:MAG: hypothetical protein A3A80_04015 [Candidatus Terrybacteria bacterium RIFCSPLOWO2_01_FULL_44_24]|uniref:Type II secretion system protein GspF domain-containing protein n=1 Tax=Candidatus Terrybacteria bacterium RIFCSPHIGHO2_01_FULL_43_35 TaxID=1802361 RepID=A0A1G2PIE0_9BACT|nr:MAG: hypothetical protein A2828_02940 [Candidatus Terrybacteria bacterium RIFCSPHIGHO2_01_FULL_43_35]OHA50175.1 MAG: hypothetical protein A3B75_01600 [Candidatus Terrybacteria bacterium RIFCSPHIGHO2_02_FULL_43_14]OHA51234.1 MAG: hypothetical protein A3A80_04015 [Candidatus Terrybacteria bacterium RIFCSPLOWO2_01_FULL_44_24]